MNIFAVESAYFGQALPHIVLQRNLIDLTFQIVPKVLWAIAILLLTRWASNLGKHVAHRVLKRTEPTIQKFLLQAAVILIWVVGIVAALRAVGIETTTVVAVVGAAGLAIGLALQSSLSHIAAGVMLVSFRPFEVGDTIEGAGVIGTVDSIGLFSTTVITPDHVRITVPNSNLFSGTLKNHTIMGTRRLDLEVDIGDRAIETHHHSFIVSRAASSFGFDRAKTDTVHVASITPTSTVLYLRPWCMAQCYEQVKSEILQLVKEALAEKQNVEAQKSSDP